jgi:Ca-activated chloride channel family protein
MTRFAHPWLLALIVPMAAAAWAMARRRARADARLILPQAEGRAAVRSPWVALDRALPWMRGAALILGVVALARPQSGSTTTSVSTDGVDIVVALDRSGSMRAEDFRPRNRLEVAKHVVASFVRGRERDRIGLVAFAGLAATRCPLTLDHVMLERFLDEIDFAPQEESGTALGMGLATAVGRLRASPAKSKVVVLVTDGRNNAGSIAPVTAAEAAAALGIRVHTIGVGSEGDAPFPNPGPFGPRYVMQPLDLDEPQLRHIASLTGGSYFRATQARALEEIFARIDALETSPIESRERILYAELFHLALMPAALLALLERSLAATRLRRLP